jgi:hypothetical protein
MAVPRLVLSILLFFLLFAASCKPTPGGDDRPASAAQVEEEGFQPVFNGSDLTGWAGATDGYSVENGKLVCRKDGGGNLYIERQFTDFVFRFEFRLEPGGNNGVGIRADMGRDAAYYGMEIQILDDSAPEYATLKPYQFHGSIYGVVPAKKGHQKPVGEWNEQEIRAEGSRITVTLNGHVIVDADVEKAAPKGKTMDGEEHPGLSNQSGYIGFLGHGHRVEFRSLRIREL